MSAYNKMMDGKHSGNLSKIEYVIWLCRGVGTEAVTEAAAEELMQLRAALDEKEEKILEQADYIIQLSAIVSYAENLSRDVDELPNDVDGFINSELAVNVPADLMNMVHKANLSLSSALKRNKVSS